MTPADLVRFYELDALQRAAVEARERAEDAEREIRIVHNQLVVDLDAAMRLEAQTTDALITFLRGKVPVISVAAASSGRHAVVDTS